MADFLEERLCTLINYGSNFQDDYLVEITETAGGQEYRSMPHPFPRRTFDVSYMLESAEMWSLLLNLYHRAHGKYAGFRARCADEYSSNGATGTPTAFDQTMGLVSAGVYQLRKYYGTDAPAGSSGYPYRIIFKPVAGTVKVSIGTTEIRAADLSVVTTSGQVTITPNYSYTVTNITKAASAVVTLNSVTGLQTGMSVGFSGILGMTQINGLRGFITAINGLNVTVGINSSGFGTWSSGGTQICATRPLSGENVKAGFEFDFPVRFNTVIPVGQDYPTGRTLDGIELIELLNP